LHCWVLAPSTRCCAHPAPLPRTTTSSMQVADGPPPGTPAGRSLHPQASRRHKAAQFHQGPCKAAGFIGTAYRTPCAGAQHDSTAADSAQGTIDTSARHWASVHVGAAASPAQGCGRGQDQRHSHSPSLLPGPCTAAGPRTAQAATLQVCRHRTVVVPSGLPCRHSLSHSDVRYETLTVLRSDVSWILRPAV
jgi:hypothetical protein